MRDITSIRLLWAAFVVLACAGGSMSAVEAQNDILNESVIESTSAGNTVQGAMMIYHQGMRQYNLALKSEEKIAEAETDKERSKLKKRSRKAWESAAQQLQAALSQGDMFEAYEPLGFAYRKLGKYDEAIKVHAMALGRDPDSMENFAGWADALVGLNQLGTATEKWASWAQEGSPRAPIMMEAIERWVAQRKADPAGLNPELVDRVAQWVDQQKALLDGS